MSTRGENPLFQGDSDTSYDAAQSVSSETLRQRVYEVIAAAGMDGATEEEASFAAGMIRQTVTARIVELIGEGRIVRSNLKRDTTSNRRAYVYIDAALLDPGDRRLLTGLDFMVGW